MVRLRSYPYALGSAGAGVAHVPGLAGRRLGRDAARAMSLGQIVDHEGHELDLAEVGEQLAKEELAGVVLRTPRKAGGGDVGRDIQLFRVGRHADAADRKGPAVLR